jgi:ribosomal protein S18 acetylase RimI-like enzyme
VTLQAAMDRNMAAYWAPYGRGADCELHEENGTVWVYTGIATPLFNGVLSANLDAEGVRGVVQALAERIARRGATAFWWIGPDARPGDIGARLERQGLKSMGSVPGMAASLATIDDREDSISGFEIRKVEGREMRAQWGRTAAIGTGFSGKAVAQMEDVEPTIDEPRYARQTRYLGFLDGEPVASSALVLDSGLAGIYAVATLPAARKRGLGRAMTLAPLLEARALGYETGILQASSSGFPIYAKMGFKEVCRYNLYLQS